MTLFLHRVDMKAPESAFRESAPISIRAFRVADIKGIKEGSDAAVVTIQTAVQIATKHQPS